MIKSKLINLVYLVLIFSLSFNNVVYAKQWAKSYGGTGTDYFWSVRRTSDGGYIAAGTTLSFSASFDNFWVLRLDENGGIVWQKMFGGASYDDALAVQQTADGGYIVAGWTQSFGAGLRDAWVLKLDGNGNPTWQKTYGGTNIEYLYAIQQTADGGYIMTGYTLSFGAGGYDILAMKLDGSGNVNWQKTYGGSADDFGTFIRQTNDGGYILTGQTLSFGAGSGDAWVLKLDGNGNPTWQKTYGGVNIDRFVSTEQASDNGYIMAGLTTSFGAGTDDFWVLKLDGNGNPTWQKTYGGSNIDRAFSIQQSTDGGYIVAGHTLSFGAGSYDFLVLKLDGSGNIVWQKTYGGTGDDEARFVRQTIDGDYLVSGYNRSFGASTYDGWILKIDPNGGITGCTAVGNPIVTVNNTAITGSNTSATVTSISVTVGNTSVTGTNITATVTQNCYYAKSGEASPPGNPLLYSNGIVTYTPANCATDHSIYWGTGTDSLSAIIWTNEICGIGTSGSAIFDPGTPAGGSFYYFVIAGNNGIVEGSYGHSTGGAERPAASTPCLVQDIAGACL